MPIYRALSLAQPWANRIRDGQKTIETRSWATSYRGALLICAARVPRIPPWGCTVCLVNLIDCRPMQPTDWTAAGIAPYTTSPFARRGRQSAAPRIIHGWHVAHVRPVAAVPVRGRLGIFTVELPDLLLSR